MFIEEWIYQKLLREQIESGIIYNRNPDYYIPPKTIRFYQISSEQFAKSEQEIKAYSMPITKILEEQSIKDLTRSIDEQIVEHIYKKFPWGK